MPQALENTDVATEDKKTKWLDRKSLATRFLPQLKAGSALLPTNRWLLDTVRELAKTCAPLQRDLRRGASIAAAGIIGFAGVVAGAFILGAAYGVVAVASVAAVAVAGAAGLAVAAKRTFEKFKTETLPVIAEAVKTRYMKMKSDEMMQAWKDKMDQRRAEKAKAPAKTALETAAPAKVEAPKPPEPKVEAVVVETPAPVAPDATPVPAPKKTSIFDMGRRLKSEMEEKVKAGAKKAEDALRKIEEADATRRKNPPPAPPKT